jgi:hypothetical protein
MLHKKLTIVHYIYSIFDKENNCLNFSSRAVNLIRTETNQNAAFCSWTALSHNKVQLQVLPILKG